MASISVTLDSGSGTPPLALISNDTVLLTALPENRTYQWTLLDKPTSSSASITNSTSRIASLQVDNYGSYLIQLTIDGYEVATTVVAVPVAAGTPWTSVRVPAVGERFEGDSTYGWGKALKQWMEYQQTLYMIQDLGDVSGATTVDFSLGNRVVVTLTGTTQFTWSNAVAGRTYHVTIKQDSTGGRSVDDWGGIYTATGTEPAISSAGDAIDQLILFKNPEDVLVAAYIADLQEVT